MFLNGDGVPASLSECYVYISFAPNEPASHSFSHACRPNPALWQHQLIV